MRRLPGEYRKMMLTTFGCICGILRSTWLPKDNTKDHQRALKELRELEEDVILPADKGNAIVVMKRSDSRLSRMCMTNAGRMYHICRWWGNCERVARRHKLTYFT